MNPSDLGSKHLCPNCATKYYDLKKKVAACPKCGTRPLVASVATAPPPRKGRRSTPSRRFP